MQYKPHDYQAFAIDFIINNKVSALLLDMGLGKTSITLTAVSELIYNHFEVTKVLIIAPLRVARDTWPLEIKKWDHLRHLTYSVVIGSKEERLKALEAKADIYFINRENIQWLVDQGNFDFDMLVLDELSSFKAPNTKRFKSLMKVRPNVKRVVGLTGTPSPNGLMDLWAQFKILDMGKRLGKFIGNYKSEFFTPGLRNGHIVYNYHLKPLAEEEIYKRISDITISMKACDHLKMPACIMNEVLVNLDKKEIDTYKKFKKNLVISIDDDEIDAVSAGALSNKLLQMANGSLYGEEKQVHQIHNRKIEALEDLIESANGKPVLIAYWFKHDLEKIKSKFNVRDIKTGQDIEDWNKGLIDIATIHPASAGHGLNLQDGGSILIWYSLTWSLELYQQTNARLYRQGQKNTVSIHHIVSKGTIDEDVIRALSEKDSNQNKLLRAVKARLKEE